jgi:hypothetical protein
MSFWLGFVGLFVLPILVGAAFAIKGFYQGHTVKHQGGWIYFLSAVGQDVDSPIKVGMTHRDPTEDRLPEIRTMSPFPLRILYKYWTADPSGEEARIHRELGLFRRHGEWFDRDATLMFIDHQKGLV